MSIKVELPRLYSGEIELLERVFQGLTNPAIGRQFNISRRTIDHRVSNLYIKFELEPNPNYHRRTMLAVIWSKIRDEYPL